MIKNNSISPTQLFFILLLTQLGATFSSGYRSLMIITGNDGWWIILIAGLVKQMILFAMWYSIKKFPDLSGSEMLKKHFGAALGVVINWLYVLYFMMVIIYLLCSYSKIMNIWVFPQTPPWVLILLGVVIILYTARHNIQSHAYMHSFGFLFIFFVVAVLLVSLYVANIDYLFPLFHIKWTPLVRGIGTALFMMIGFETAFFYMRYVRPEKPKNVLIAVSAANIVSTILFLLIVLVSTLGYTVSEFGATPLPVNTLAKSFSFGILTRFDIVYLLPWTWIVLTAIMSYAFLLNRRISEGLGKMIPLTRIIWVTSFIIMVVAVLFSTITRVMMLQTALQYFFIINAVAIPVIALVIILFKRRLHRDV